MLGFDPYRMEVEVEDPCRTKPSRLVRGFVSGAAATKIHRGSRNRRATISQGLCHHGWRLLDPWICNVIVISKSEVSRT